MSVMVQRLRELRAANSSERLRDGILRWIEDPLQPRTARGRLRISPILLLLVSLAVIATGTFLFFSLVQP